MATLGANLKAMANLQANEFQKIIKSLQVIAEARTVMNTLTAPQPPHIPAATTGEEEAIIWEQVSTDNVPPPEVLPTRPPQTCGPNPGQTRED